MDVWSPLVGQADAVAQLRVAVADAHQRPTGPAMTHAWLFTGPPGSGRSLAATAFAAGLLCADSGCGECEDCRLVAAGGHPDLTLVRPQGLSYGTAETRELVRSSSASPARGRWHVVVIEDADRLTETANNVLLKAIEEPPERTVWVLCTPSVEDVLPTIRSRCRHVSLRTPATADIAAHLAESEGLDEATAMFAARAAQGHVGRARALARDADARVRRQQVLAVPHALTDLQMCMKTAATLVTTAQEQAVAATQELDAAEREDFLQAWGDGAEGKGLRGAQRGVKGAMKELDDRQAKRRTRAQRDELDRVLLDLMALYRDVLAHQFGADDPNRHIELVNGEARADIVRLAQSSDPVSTMRRLDALERARLALAANVAPILAMEALTVDLRNPDLRYAVGQ